MIPPLDDLLEPIQTTHGAVCGLREDRKAIDAKLSSVSWVAVLDVLESRDQSDVKTLLGALVLIQYMPKNHIQSDAYQERVLAALTACACDARSYTIPWGDASYQRKVFSLADRAVDVLHIVLENIARSGGYLSPSSPERTERDAYTRRALLAAFAATLLHHTSSGTRALLSSWRRPFLSAQGHEETAQALCDLCVAQALDTRALGHHRAHASRSLGRAARLSPAILRPIFEEGADRVATQLVHEHESSLCDVHLRPMLPKLIQELAPEKLEALLTAAPETSLEAHHVLTRWGRFDPGKTQRLALHIAASRLEDIVCQEPPTTPSKRIAALCLLSVMTQRVAWKTVASYLLDAIHDRRILTLPPNSPKGRPTDVCVGTIALQRLSSLISSHWRLHPAPCTALIFHALDICLNVVPVSIGSLDDELQTFLRELRWGPKEVTHALHARLSSWCLDSELPPHTRFCALSATRSRTSPKLALSVLLNAEESPDLRALLGANIARWSSTALHDLIENEPTASRWIAKEEFRDLPICEPAQRVPTSWLFASVRAAEHASLRRHAVRHLGTRFSLLDALRGRSLSLKTQDEESASSESTHSLEHIQDNLYRLHTSQECTQVHSNEGEVKEVDIRPMEEQNLEDFDAYEVLTARCGELRDLSTPWLLEALRFTVDTSSTDARSTASWGAATALALCGHAEDHDRLLHVMLERDLWTRVCTLTHPEALLALAHSIVLDPLTHRDPHHLLEPYLIIGYGEEVAARLVSRLFIRCAARAYAESDLVRARLGCIHASRWDPLNLNARQGAQDPERLFQALHLQTDLDTYDI